MIPQSGIIYIRKESSSTAQPGEREASLSIPAPSAPSSCAPQPKTQHLKPGINVRRVIGVVMIAIAAFGIIMPIIPQARVETSYATRRIGQTFSELTNPKVDLPPAVPVVFTPLIGPDGKEIQPVNTEFSIVIPKLGINAPVVASVDPLNQKEYMQALQKGVAHAKTSYFPNQDGATYLFSHSTNYQWFVKDLNAIFYNIKNLEHGDLIVLFYKGKQYTYRFASREIVQPKDISYLLPVTGKRQLILQTCWPPGTLYQRLLIFAELVEEQGTEI
jgi:LPXTG-site transpeptidase (sortase) family protein